LIKPLPVILFAALLVTACKDQQQSAATVDSAVDQPAEATKDDWQSASGADPVTDVRFTQIATKVAGSQHDLVAAIRCDMGEVPTLSYSFNSFNRNGTPAPTAWLNGWSQFILRAQDFRKTFISQTRFFNAFGFTENARDTNFSNGSIPPLGAPWVLRISLLDGEETWIIPTDQPTAMNMIQQCRGAMANVQAILLTPPQSQPASPPEEEDVGDLPPLIVDDAEPQANVDYGIEHID
jgi:hypothetical protein